MSERRLFMMRDGISYIAAFCAVLVLGGCGIYEDWFEGEGDPPLPGERISVLLTDTDAAPDPRLADLDIKLPKPYTNRAWPQAGGYPDHAMHHLAVSPEQLQKVWEVDAGAASEGDQRVLAAPIIADGRVFTVDRDFEIYAFDAESGARQWRFQPEVPDEDDEAFGGGIAYHNGRIFLTTGFAQIYAIDARTGQEIWNVRGNGPMRAPPAVGDGKVVAVSIDNRTIAVDEETGEEVWQHAGFAEAAGLIGGASPAIADNTVVVPYSSGEVFALRLSNGQTRWSDSLTSIRRSDALSSLSDIRARPIIDRGVVYSVSHAGRMVAIDERSGARGWDRRIGGIQSPWIAGEFLYMITLDQSVLAITRRGGRVRWATPLPNFEDPEDREDAITWVGPILVGDRLLLGNSLGELWSLSPYTGAPLGKVDVGAGVSVPPVVAGGTVYVLTEDGELIAFR